MTDKEKEMDRFFLRGTFTPPYDIDCIFNDGIECKAFQMPRNSELLSGYIRAKNCPKYKKNLNEKANRIK